ncbi:MAG: cytidylate kinase [Bacteroidetes bacterium]|nr:cytidylate kinase [Bacteroidota bacterium]
MQKITIAIDGFSSCGKSTLAKALAQRLNYSYVDTGAMYRAVTLFALQNGLIDKDQKLDEEGLINSLDKIELSFIFDAHTKSSQTFLNGVNVDRDIRSMEVSGLVSMVSSIKKVREKMIALQRQMGKKKGVVMDGRDIGTNVFPKADLKIFMTADNDVRAQRRLDEYTSKGQYFTKEEVKRKLMKRDHDDSTRKENPLTQAEDAIVLDNSDISREDQLEFVLKLIDDLHLLMKEQEKEKERQRHH